MNNRSRKRLGAPSDVAAIRSEIRKFMPQKRWAEALELMEQSLRISERLAARDRSNGMWQSV